MVAYPKSCLVVLIRSQGDMTVSDVVVCAGNKKVMYWMLFDAVSCENSTGPFYRVILSCVTIIIYDHSEQVAEKAI